jgi:hypothetical protein
MAGSTGAVDPHQGLPQGRETPRTGNSREEIARRSGGDTVSVTVP